MLEGLLIIAAVFLFVIAPCWTVLKYYQPAKFSLSTNFFLVLLTVLTWPLIPVVVATKKSDRLILSMFWVSLLIFMVALAYWLTVNVETFIELQDKFLR